MSRQSPRRSGRNQGLRMKHVLQISVLLGVGIWLLYQLQQPFERHSAVEVNKYSENVSETIDLGRKDLKQSVRAEDAEEDEEEKRVEDHLDEELNSEDESKLEAQELQEVANGFGEENSDRREENMNREGDDGETEHVKLENEDSGSETHGEEITEDNTETRENEGQVIKENEEGDHLLNSDGEKTEGNGSKEDDTSKEAESEKIEETVGESTSNETVTETKAITSDDVKQETQEEANHDVQSSEVKHEDSNVSLENKEGEDLDQGKISDVEAEESKKNSTVDSSSVGGQEESRYNETIEGVKEVTTAGEAEKEKVDHESSDGSGGADDQQAKVDVNTTGISIPSLPSNGTILEQSEKSNSSDENPGSDSGGKPDDANGNHTASSEGQSDESQRDPNPDTSSSSQEMDEKPSATDTNVPENQNNQVDSSNTSVLQEEKDARTDIETLPDSGTGDNSHQEAIAK